jgi:uncharacterized alkaline shock family protein YloU
MPATIRQKTRESAKPSGAELDVRRDQGEAAPPRGEVSIAESVVEKIAANAARTVQGIYPAGDVKGFASGLARAVGANVNGGTEGIRAHIRRNREVSLEMRMAVDYGEHMPTRGEEVRVAVARTIGELTDLDAREIKVKITEVLLPEATVPEVN